MARPHLNPRPEPDDPWPACDERPPGISIRPLRHGDLPALLAHLNHQREPDRDENLLAGSAGRRAGVAGPVVAVRVRVRASVGAPAPAPTPSTGADALPIGPPGAAACPGGWPWCWPPA
jgi:hypothetical protein